MKVFYITILLLLGTIEPKFNIKKVIVFEHSGNTDSILRPLVICTENIYIPLNENDIDELRRAKGRSKLTMQEKKNFSDFINIKAITNKLTYSMIGKFVLDHTDYYVNNSNNKESSGVQSFEVVYNGKVHVVYSKLSHKYLNNLKAYLILCRCDLKVVAQFADFRY